MAVNVPPMENLLPVPGVTLGTAYAAVKAATAAAEPDQSASPKHDLAVVQFAPGSTVAGVFTQSVYRAAPVQECQRLLGRDDIGGFVINSGNANAATGAPGLADARQVAQAVAQIVDGTKQIMPFSTGVIGERLPVAAIVDALPKATKALAVDQWGAAAEAIMTTDTVPKALSLQAQIGGHTVTATGMAKGSGMIRPDMATMLGYLCCDAQVPTPVLQALCLEVADASFNRITVDGDTSTNDSFMLVASAQSPASVASTTQPEYAELKALLIAVARDLAQRIVRDAEGATKFVTVEVVGGDSEANCLQVAYTVAHSPLVKTALFASDPNWGRFCMAIGRAGVEFDPDEVNLYLDDLCVAENGLTAPTYTEAAGASIMAQAELTVRIEIGTGAAAAKVWTSDLSYDYVRINSEYRS